MNNQYIHFINTKTKTHKTACGVSFSLVIENKWSNKIDNVTCCLCLKQYKRTQQETSKVIKIKNVIESKNKKQRRKIIERIIKYADSLDW